MSHTVCASLSIALLFVIGAFNARPSQTLQIAGFQPSKERHIYSTNLSIVAGINKDGKTGALILKWSLRNTSNRDISTRDTNLLNDYRIEITDYQNKRVPPTEEGQKQLMAARMLSHRSALTIHPGEEIKSQIVISEIYDMKRKGTYTVTIKRRLATEEVKSNPVKVKISG